MEYTRVPTKYLAMALLLSSVNMMLPSMCNKVYFVSLVWVHHQVNRHGMTLVELPFIGGLCVTLLGLLLGTSV